MTKPRVSWQWIGLAITVIALGAAFLSALDSPFPSPVVGLVLVWAGLALLLGAILAAPLGWLVAFVRTGLMYEALARWNRNGSKPEDYPEWIRRPLYGPAEQWLIERDGALMRLRNTGVDASVTVLSVRAIGRHAITFEVDLPVAIPRGASFELVFGTVAGLGIDGVLVRWSRPSGGEIEELYYR